MQRSDAFLIRSDYGVRVVRGDEHRRQTGLVSRQIARAACMKTWMLEFMVEWRRIELPTFALRIRIRAF
jgi:hypothetical protein